jgi:prepilin-type N-terminal cleavage/methylation domain-containing protein
MKGVTLVELLVVLALLGVMLGVSTLAITALRRPVNSETVEMEKARREAVQSGTPRTAHGALFLPDGRAIGPGVDPLTGAMHAK